MRTGITAVFQLIMLLVCSTSYAQKLTPEQQEPWAVLVTQVNMDANRDFEAMKQYMHPQGSFWGNHLPHPVTNRSYAYYVALRAGEDEIVAHHLVPVTVVVVGDVAIIDAYLHILSRSDEDKQEEKILRLHNTWKKENGKWLLLATYNTEVEP